jgi:hypothetical protein
MLGHHRDDDRWVFRALALVDRRGIGRDQRVEFPEAVGDCATVEVCGELAQIRIDIVDEPDVAVVDLLVVVVLPRQFRLIAIRHCFCAIL